MSGSIASSSLTTVNNGGTLTGTGIVGNTIINSGGLFAPGNGTAGSFVAVSGNLAFQSGALYLVQVGPAAASFANVAGVATLSGATVNAFFAPGSSISRQYTILSAAGGVAGAFAPTPITNLPANIQSALSYDANDVFLNFNLNLAASGQLNGNQQGVGNALGNFFNHNGSIPLVFTTLSAGNLTQASGETATGSQQATFNAMTQFMGIITDPSIGGRGNVAGPATGAPAFAEESDSAKPMRGRPQAQRRRARCLCHVHQGAAAQQL